MQYEYSIVCTACGQMSAQGSLEEPVTMTEEEALSIARHHASCPVLHKTAVNTSEQVVERKVNDLPVQVTVKQYVISW